VRRISFVILLALAAVSLAAQTRPNQPTFRGGAAYVRVDMYATRDGKPIEDIQATEVEIREDGVPQMVEAFEHVRVRTGIPQELRVEPKSVEQSRQMAGDPRARVFVIFLDTYHTQFDGSATMRQPLLNFIDRVLGPDDMVAVMTPEMAATEITFQRKTTVISRMLEREWMWGRRGRAIDNDEREDLYEACYPNAFDTAGVAIEMKARRREKLTLDALDDLIVHLAGIREERKAVLTVTEGWLLYRPDPKLARAIDGGSLKPGDVLLRPPRPQPSDAAQVQGSPRVQCEADRMALGALDHDFRLQQLTQTANRGNVTFYPVYARGLVALDAPIGPDKPPASPLQDASNLKNRQEGLRLLAADTDGTSVINTNNIDAALRRIVDDLSSYYLMGYYTTNAKLDGRFRSITVRVKRPGVSVRARKGYRSYTVEELSRGGVNPVALDATGGSAATAPATVAPPAVNFSARAQFRIRAAAWSRSGLAGGTVWVVGEIDQQTKRLPAWTRGAQGEIAVTAAADNTQVAAQRFELKPGESTFTAQLPDTGGLQSGDYTVRVRLRSPVEGELGLIDTARISMKSPPSLGDAVMWRRGPSTGPQHLRTADPRFQRSERVRLELPTSLTEPATARVVDRSGQPMSVPAEVSTRPDPSGSFTWVVVDLGLAPFSPADYGIEVTQGQVKEVTAFRVIP
jgi:VWFA-related protein